MLREVTFAVSAGEIVGLIGPNGTGKTTALRLASGVLSPGQGAVLVGKAAVHHLNPRARAMRIAMLEQDPPTPPGFTVQELVALGRYAHSSPFRSASRDDAAAVAVALQACQLERLAERRLDHLSGGERRRAFVAMALAQQTPVLLLDEPFAHLDLAHVAEIAGVLDRLREQSKAILLAAHDINTVLTLASRIAILWNGRVQTFTPSEEGLSVQILQEVFGVEIEVHGHGDAMWVRPLFARRPTRPQRRHER